MHATPAAPHRIHMSIHIYISLSIPNESEKSKSRLVVKVILLYVQREEEQILNTLKVCNLSNCLDLSFFCYVQSELYL